MARLTVARKIAAIVLIMWKKGEPFDPGQLKRKQLEHNMPSTCPDQAAVSIEESRWTIPEVVAEPLAQSRFSEALGFEGEYLVSY